MQCRFEVGQRVALIPFCGFHPFTLGARIRSWFKGSPVLREGQIYRISKMSANEHGIWLQLAGHDWVYQSIFFRPLGARDISVGQFERLLVDLPERVGERA